MPGAIPALDAPIVFPCTRNAVLVGFYLLVRRRPGQPGAARRAVPSPPSARPAASSALLHRWLSGRRQRDRRPAGAAIGSFLNGVLITFPPAFPPLGVLGSFGSANTTFGDADFGWLGLSSATSRRPAAWRGSS
ncbi:hypothetical protein [Streptomyces sp. KL116D]|uniref:hypothetical protein n=1 Tax=Streptomyces sp. KL116D TaxID=3045152 RepID=UPI003556DA3C